MSKTIELVCDESVDISAVGELYTKVTTEMEDGCTISFDASQVERVDTAALQFFAVLFNDAPTKNININWINPSDILKNSAKLLGLGEHLQLNT